MTSTTARQRAIIAAEQAKSAAAMDAAKKEETARNADITVVATSYDATTGDWVASTPDGGTVRAQSLTNGSLSGLRLPLQRFSGSQTARINAPPTDADSGWVVSEMESSQRDMYQLLGVEAFPFRLDGQPDGTYVIDPYQDYRVRIESLNGVSGATVTVSPAVGEIAEIGSAISITVSGSESGTPVLGKISLRRV